MIVIINRASLYVNVFYFALLIANRGHRVVPFIYIINSLLNASVTTFKDCVGNKNTFLIYVVS